MRPGTNVIARTSPPARGAPTETGRAFIAGEFQRGPVTEAREVRNLGELISTYGDAVSYSVAHAAIETIFREGGTSVVVARAGSPGADTASLTLNDRAGSPVPTLTVNANSPGVWGNDIEVTVIDGATNEFILIITYGDIEERSPSLASPGAAVAWALANSNLVVIEDEASVTAVPANRPALAAGSNLTGGDDDRASITDTHRAASLALFDRAFGPGQVAYPGATTVAMHTALANHGANYNRFALADLPNTNNVATLTAAVVAAKAAVADSSYLFFVGPWVIVPSSIQGVRRTIPPSALVAGLMARSDAGNSTNVPAAGQNGEARYAVGVTQSFTDAQRETLNEASVNIIRSLFGTVTLYGYRTASENESWLSAGAARLRMQITNDATIYGDRFVFDQVDGKGQKLAEFGGGLTGLLKSYYDQGALYGITPDDAYSVDVGGAINTNESLANGELRAVLSLRTSPFAEMITIEIVKIPITESV